jgi:redox-sensitive bicupin YhaK (pirin superfamily)
MWILPRERGLTPSVEQKAFMKEERTDRLLRIISGEDGDSVLVHQDASVYVSSLSPGASVEHAFEPGSGAYFYLISGRVGLNTERLATGDAAKIEEEPGIRVEAEELSELIMVEVRLG